MAGLPDDTRPEPIDLLAGLMADQRDRTERGAVLGARDDIDQAMTANYRLTGDAMSYPWQTVHHDASISAEAHREDVGVVLLQVDVGDRVHIDLELDVDTARGFVGAIQRSIVECEAEA